MSNQERRALIIISIIKIIALLLSIIIYESAVV